MHILLTGHLGYVGPAVLAALKETGHHVTGFDVGYFRECIDSSMPIVVPDVELSRDIRDVTENDLRGVEAVVHLSGLSNDPLGQLNPALTKEINTAATLHLAHIAKICGVERFVFASSCSLYGASSDAARPLDEEAELRPSSAYAESKVECEHGLARLAGGRFAPVFLRFATAFGVSPRMRFDLVLANLVAWARITGTIKVLSDGTPWRPLVHIADMAQAIVCAVTASTDAVSGRAFNIGRTDNNVQVHEIAEIVRRQVPGSHVDITGEAGGDPRSYRVDFTRALTELPGFQPRWTIEMGAREIDAWLVERSLDRDQFQSRLYVRLKQLQYLQQRGELDATLRFRYRHVNLAGVR